MFHAVCRCIKEQCDSWRGGSVVLWADGKFEGMGEVHHPAFNRTERLETARRLIHTVEYNNDAPVIPKRVIDVGKDREDPFLYVSEGERAHYITLSHCWGSGENMLTTTTNTLNDRMNQISMLSLPATFRDAVLIARKLEIRYLWIDSLCIVQDDELEWEVESSQMATIYSNSDFTIAAMDAINASEGFLKPMKNPWKLYSGLFGANFIQGGGECIFAYPLPDFDFSIDACFLSSRGWCLQELALSSRILYCTNERMYWQHQGGVLSEDEFLAGMLLNMRTQPAEGPRMKYALNGIGLERIFSRRRRWWILVEDYSTRNLTYMKDKLPAIAGITEFFQSEIQDVCLAGLWRDDLHYSLLWRCGSVSMSRPQESLGIPSWSWTSLDGPIKVPLTDKYYIKGDDIQRQQSTTHMADILMSEIVRRGKTEASQITSGKIVVRTRLLSCTCKASFTDAIIDRTGPVVRYSPLVIPNSISREDLSYNAELSIGWCALDTLPHGVDRVVTCLEVSMTDWASRIGPVSILSRSDRIRTNNLQRTHEVLIIEETEDVNGGWRRIGIGMLDADLRVFDGVNATTVALV